jgi:ribosomal protein S18 acetylase RimI-like enzyme
MTSSEFDTFCGRMIREYARENVRAGTWNVDEAEVRSAQRLEELLPDGIYTAGMLILTAVANADPVGDVWMALDHGLGTGGGDAWIYYIEIRPEQRGKGYGRALLRAAEQEVARRGAKTIGLNVFWDNAAARSLYASAGYETISAYMRKAVKPL